MDSTPELKKQLTVRPLASGDFPQPPAFKVYRETSRGKLIVPRFFDTSHPHKHSTPVHSPRICFNGTLRNETSQVEAHTLGVESLSTIGGGVLSLPCGFGKTAVSLSIASHFKVRTMIIVHKEVLVRQWIERIQQFSPGATIGRVQCDTIETDNDFVISMIQTLSQRDYQPGTFDSIGLVIVDEAHHICARAFSRCMFKLQTKYMLGLTATPERKDGLTRLLYWFLGPQFLAVERNAENVEVRFVPFTGPFPPITMTRNGKLSLPTIITDLTLVDERNELILETIRGIEKFRNILVLTERREHALWICDQIGSEAGVYIGGMTEDSLGESAEKRVIVATFALAQEGLDIPKLDTLILASPKSDVKQAVGRVLRGSTNPIIYDIVDKWSIFIGSFKRRSSIYTELKFNTPETAEPVKQTLKCLL